MFDLHSALDLENFWQANLRLLQSVMPHHSCSLMLGIVDFQPHNARHHVVKDHRRDYQPATSLSVSKKFLEAHPQAKMYTYADVVREDPAARMRRLEQEAEPGDWNQFIHLAFWDGSRPDAVLSVRRSAEQGDFLPLERQFLAHLHPMIDAGLHRLRSLEREHARRAGMERYLSSLPLPVMFLDADARLNFATQEAYDLTAVWNFGVKEAKAVNTRRAFQVPAEMVAACARLAALRDAAALNGVIAGLSGERLVHPTIPWLIARVDVSQPIKGAWVRPGFLVTYANEHNMDGAAGAELSSSSLSALQPLTPSERRVALLVAEGCRNIEVARRLGRSLRTVEFQLNSIYRKLGVSNRTQLARLLV